jgi:tetratricopeptide (TPR) repeat protein
LESKEEQRVKYKPLALLSLSAALAAHAGTVPFETTERQLESAIDRASEQGHFDEVGALRLELARQATARGFYFDAARQYELLLAARPSRKERVRLFTELGRLRETTGDFAGAIHAYEDARHDDSHSWPANLRVAGVYAHEGMYGQAEQAYLKCLVLRPGDLEARDGLGDLYKDRGFLKQAIAVYQETLRRRPTAESFSGLAECYWRANDFKRAIETLEKAKASGVPGDYDTPLGFVYRRQGDFALAAATWEKALALHPDRADLKLNLVWVYAPLGRMKDAEQLAEELLSAYPHSPLVHFTQAWLKLRQGHEEGARLESRKVDELSPTDLVKHYNERLIQGIQK